MRGLVRRADVAGGRVLGFAYESKAQARPEAGKAKSQDFNRKAITNQRGVKILRFGLANLNRNATIDAVLGRFGVGYKRNRSSVEFEGKNLEVRHERLLKRPRAMC